MNYLRIENNGLICAEDLMLIGSSTKREQTDKIGMFGSGWKYALSWLLRNESNPVIFSGEKEIKVDFEISMHRDNPVRVITVDGVKTSLTTEMGPKWTGWMCLREIISNAIDEGGYKMRTEYNPTFTNELDKTVIYVPLNTELAKVMLDFDSYFSFDRKPSYTFKSGKVFVKPAHSNVSIYRKGIRCSDYQFNSVLDFDLTDVNIDENRISSWYDVTNKIKEIVSENTDCILLKTILQHNQESWLPYSMNDNILEALKQLIASGEKFTTTNIRNLTGSIMTGASALQIRQEWYDKLRELKLIKSAFNFFGHFQFIRTDDKETKGIEYHLKQFNVSCEIQTGECSKEAVFHNDVAYVKATTKLSDAKLASLILGSMTSSYFGKLLGETDITAPSAFDEDELPF